MSLGCGLEHEFSLFSISSYPLTDIFVHTDVTPVPSLLQCRGRWMLNAAPPHRMLRSSWAHGNGWERHGNYQDLVGEETRGVELQPESHSFAVPLSNARRLRSAAGL